MSIKLSLAVQYGTSDTAPPRAWLRQRVQRTLDLATSLEDLDLQGAVLTVRIVDATEGRELNKAYRKRDYATNVLTFAYGTDPDGVVSADIVLCADVLDREAREQHKTVNDHAAHLLVHSVLHALGYDHTEAVEATVMEGLETRILASMGIADPYTSTS